MDGTRFDRLVRDLLGDGSRRGLLRHLSAIPLAGGLASLLEEDIDAKKRRKKRRQDEGPADERKKKHKKRKKKKCKSKAKVCKGKCGTVTHKCHKHKRTVNCGPCACNPPCGECLICNADSGTCEPDPSQQGDACGETGQVCQSNGDCACDATSCPTCATCQGSGECTTPCGGTGCCDSGTCQDGDEATACGTGGATCEVCSGDTPFCDNGACVSCSASEPCPSGQVCCGGDCVSGVCCEADDCAPAGNACVSNECQCGGDAACGGNAPDCCGDPGACTNTDSDPHNCGSCGGVPCTADTPRCWDGVCVCGDVCNSGCQFSQVQDAIDAADAGATIIVCAGTFSGPLTIAKDLTILGAGQGTEPTTSTILQGTPTASVIAVSNGEVAFQNLRIADGHAPGDGGGINGTGATALALSNCTIIDNVAAGRGGGLFSDSDLTMDGCLVTDNQADDRGGGLAQLGDSSTATIDGTTFTVNNSGMDGGGIYVSQSAMNVSNGDIGVNASTFDGGGLFIDGGDVTLTSSQVLENVAGQNGGGIYNLGLLTLDASVVGGNDAGSGFTGGGIFNDGSAGFGTSSCTNESHIDENTPDQCVTFNGGICGVCS